MPYHSKMEKNSPMGIKKKLSPAVMRKLKEHSKAHEGGMMGKHMKNMRKFMEQGDTFSTAHTKAKSLDKNDKKSKPKMAEAKLGGETIKFRRGGLHRSLKVPMEYTFKTAELRKLNKVETGKDFSFQGKKIKMTPLIKKQLTLGINLMKK
jgi:hypothetical protein